MNENKKTIAVIDDDSMLLDSVADYMRQFYNVITYDDGGAILAKINSLDIHFDAIVCDLRVSVMDGMTLLKNIKLSNIELPFIMITAHGDVPTAVQAIHAGAYDFIEKPFHPKNLKKVIDQALITHQLKLENIRLKNHPDDISALDHLLVGQSNVVKTFRQQIFDLVGVNKNLLLLGESGVERDVIARAIHYHSPQSNYAFVEVNCRVASELLFGDLFLGSKGAFSQTKNAGVIFLNRIDHLPIESRYKLLPLIKNLSFRQQRSGCTTQVIFSANTQPSELRENTFIKKIYTLLNPLVINVPPLRERGDDILELFYLCLKQLSSQYILPVPTLSSQDISALSSYHWDNNLQQLKQIAEQFLLSSNRQNISIDYLLRAETTNITHISHKTNKNLREATKAFEKQLIIQALIEYSGSIYKVCDLLKIPRRTLNTKLLAHGLSRSVFLKK